MWIPSFLVANQASHENFPRCYSECLHIWGAGASLWAESAIFPCLGRDVTWFFPFRSCLHPAATKPTVSYVKLSTSSRAYLMVKAHGLAKGPINSSREWPTGPAHTTIHNARLSHFYASSLWMSRKDKN